MVHSALGDLVFTTDKRPYFYALTCETSLNHSELLATVKRVIRRLVRKGLVEREGPRGWRRPSIMDPNGRPARYNINLGPYEDLATEAAHQLHRVMNRLSPEVIQSFKNEGIDLYVERSHST